MYRLRSDSLQFPSPELADENGLLAYGGDLSPERILAAYEQGIFPWFNEGSPPLWWSPNPRFVLFPENIKISKSMRQVLRRRYFTITVNHAFEQVIRQCRCTPRPGQEGTWITEEVEQAYYQLHRQGWAHSVEAWQNGQLVGGLYGLIFERCFFGESMFTHVSNASKAAFITLVANLKKADFVLVDCQVYTEHLESLGAEMIPRRMFIHLLRCYGRRIKFDLQAVFDPLCWEIS
ncbi:MAG: leucyl/phenylalanyl-tRNA--protein transferase [Cytophagales bacterium]|nr:leucyl/phenylalanyl-tRNA--protein transferase [Bernardetiaceae bacterium]MDW8210726.1 leucyl/phenylalanyl-tRNA--protein transferase [Cytophagales bacterium]